MIFILVVSYILMQVKFQQWILGKKSFARTRSNQVNDYTTVAYENAVIDSYLGDN